MRTVKLLFLTLLLLSCRRVDDGTRPGMDIGYEQFIATMVELKSNTPDKRASILKKHRVTEAELRKFVTTHARNPALLSAIFDSVQVRVDRKSAQRE